MSRSPDGGALPEGAVEGYQMITEFLAPGYEQHLVSMSVRLCGLAGRADLNGQVWSIVSFDESTGRMGVELSGDDGRMAIRPANLQLNWRKGDPIPGTQTEGMAGAASSSAFSTRAAADAMRYMSLEEQLAQADAEDAERADASASAAAEEGALGAASKSRRK